MANNNLFHRALGWMLPKTDAANDAQAPAYQLEPAAALAQLAATGCFNSTFYASAETQLSRVLELARQVDAERVARTAVYAWERGRMKDMPALLLAELVTRSPELASRTFHRVATTPKMVRNFVQILRSGVVGRRSLGSVSKKLVANWLAAQSDEQLFRGAVGNSPSLADLVRMVHPKPATEERRALYAYLLGRTYDASKLPPLAASFEAYKEDRSLPVPEVPFQYLTSLSLGRAEWAAIARRASWQSLRMNLNTFARHQVFEDPEMVELVANRLKDPQEIRRARPMPYQLLAAYRMSQELPGLLRGALHEAMEIALENVPTIAGKVYVLVDVSGSMASSITGQRQGATSAIRCVDVAALVASAILRRNPDAEVLPFDSEVVRVALEPRDTVMTNTQRLAALLGGGTNCSAPLAALNRRRAKGELVVYVSDNESWMDQQTVVGGSPTATLKEWQLFKDRNPGSRLVTLDLVPNTTSQVVEREDVIRIGGFSDDVFTLLADVNAGHGGGHWLEEIDTIEL